MSFDWPHNRVIAWASWARCTDPGSNGGGSGYMREALDKEHEGLEPSPEIVITDKAVARMKVSREKQYWKVFAAFYLDPTELSEYEISRHFDMSVERVTAIIRQSLMLIGHNIYQIEKGFTMTKKHERIGHSAHPLA